MGWLFGWKTRKELIDHLVKDNGVVTLKHCFVGNDMWAVQEYESESKGETTRFIALYMLRGRNGSRDGWGYKDVSESMGPNQRSCPLSYLDMVPDPGSYATEWRKDVREHHRLRNRKLAVGTSVVLYDKPYTVLEAVGNGIHRLKDADGYTWRVKRSQLKDIVEVQHG